MFGTILVSIITLSEHFLNTLNHYCSLGLAYIDEYFGFDFFIAFLILAYYLAREGILSIDFHSNNLVKKSFDSLKFHSSN